MSNKNGTVCALSLYQPTKAYPSRTGSAGRERVLPLSTLIGATALPPAESKVTLYASFFKKRSCAPEYSSVITSSLSVAVRSALSPVKSNTSSVPVRVYSPERFSPITQKVKRLPAARAI